MLEKPKYEEALLQLDIIISLSKGLSKESRVKQHIVLHTTITSYNSKQINWALAFNKAFKQN